MAGSRSLRHQVVVTASGARRSTSLANAYAALRTSAKPHRGRIRTYTCRPAPPEVLGQPVAPKLGQDLHPARCGPPGARCRTRTAAWGPGRCATRPGALGVGPARVPRMELHRGHLHRPQHAGQLGDAQLVGVPAVAREAHPHRLQPRRRAAGHPLLVHLLAGHPGGKPMQHARPLAQRPDDPLPHRQVVAGQVELGLAAGREIHPVRVGDAHRPVPDLELRRCGHRYPPSVPHMLLS